jgi:hypothetical protein
MVLFGDGKINECLLVIFKNEKMKKEFSLFILLFTFYCFSQLSVTGGPLYPAAKGPFSKIVKSGMPSALIMLPSEPTYLEEYAAAELQKYIKLISKAEIPVLREGVKGKHPYTFYIGKTLKASGTLTDPAEGLMGNDGFEIRSVKQGLIIRGINEIGSLFGVYELLERCFDVRWFMPGDSGLYYPQKKDLSMGQLNFVFKPSFLNRWIYDGEWALHMRMNSYVNAGGIPVGIKWKWGYHTYNKLMPPEVYFNDHPEYFSLVKGKRTMTTDPKAQGNQLCTSNPAVIKEVARNLIDSLKADPGVDIVNFCPDDNRRFCECENCRALDEPDRDFYGQYTRRFAIFSNEVAKIVKKEFPDVLIKIGAYEMYMRPPLDKDFKFESNLVFQLCHLWSCHNHPLGSDMCKEGTTYKAAEKFLPNQDFERVLEEWLKVSRHVYIYEYYSISGMSRANLPWPLIHTMRTDIPYYRDKGAEGFYSQASSDWTKLGLNNYIAAKLCWNADLNTDDLIEDYFDKFYGPAAIPAREYYMTMEKAMIDWNGCASYGIYGVPGLKDIAPLAFTPEVLKKMEQFVIEAEKSVAGNAKASKQAALLRRAFNETVESINKITANIK